MILALLLAASVPCHWNHARDATVLPDPACTPGAALGHTQAQVLKPGFSKASRNVTKAMLKECLLRYGVEHAKPGEYECDHLISVCADGASEFSNLYPQPAKPEPGFHQKDLVEAWACREMRAGRYSLPQAQEAIRHWTDHLTHARGKWKAVK